jgi:hypothetical protein
VAQGLRIDGVTAAEAAVKAPQAAQPTATAESEAVATVSLESQFGKLLDSRLESAAGARPETVALLRQSLVETAVEVDKLFGEAAADEFRLAALAGASDGLSEVKLSYYISDFFYELATSGENSPSFKSKLSAIKDYLNEGLAPLEGGLASDQAEEASGSKGLAYALNSYFYGADFASQDGKYNFFKKFEEDFSWVTVSKKPQAQAQAQAAKGDGLKGAESSALGQEGESALSVALDDEALAGTLSFLAEEIGNINAVNYFAKEAKNDVLKSVSTTFGIIAEENGQEKALKFEAYLNADVAPNVGADEGFVLESWSLDANLADPLAVDGVASLGHNSPNPNEAGGQKRSNGQSLSVAWRLPATGETISASFDIGSDYASFKSSPLYNKELSYGNLLNIIA